MEKVINVLYEIEEKANRILDRTAQEKTKLYNRLQTNLEKLDTDIKQDTNDQLDLLKNNMEAEIAKERFAQTEECNKQLTAMEQTYMTNHDALVEKVFQRMIHV